jgi:methyl-accepting chemotaxis protein
LLANLRIGTKVATGFAAVLLIVALSSTLAYLAFGRSAAALDDYGKLSSNSAILRDIDIQTVEYRWHAREFVFSNDGGTGAAALRDGEALRQGIAAALTRIGNPERHRLLEDAARQAGLFGAALDHVRAMLAEQYQLQTDVLDVVGGQATDGFTALVAGAAKSDDIELSRVAADGRRLILLARLDANKLLGRHDAASAKSAEQHFAELVPVLAQLDAVAKDPGLIAIVKASAGQIERYRAALLHAASLQSEQLALVNGAMKQAADALADDTAKAKDSNTADLAATETIAKSITASGQSQVLWLGLAGFALGAALAWLIGRGISRPVIGMSLAMRALADGDQSVAIPGTGGTDELGQMAASVAVFKNNMIESGRRHAEQETLKQRSADDRRKTMFDLAAKFEASAGGIVTGVTGQATELQATAQSMAAIAEETTRQSSTVASASEQATQNVNTVAAATEELSASVREILQQITQSNHLIAETVTDANQANHDMQGLATAMDRIGEVVGLINNIASQTNLLALNATIEAARAGEAGKGFAVVASEVKALASQTAKATQDISTQIGAIQEATRGSVQSIQGITARIGRVSEAAAAIASAVEQQGAATAEIARNVAEAARGTGEVSSNIASVNAAAQSSTTAASEVLASAGSLSQNSEALKAQVDSFLLEIRAA